MGATVCSVVENRWANLFGYGLPTKKKKGGLEFPNIKVQLVRQEVVIVTKESKPCKSYVNGRAC